MGMNLTRKMNKNWKMVVKVSNATGEVFSLSSVGAKGSLPEVFRWMGIVQTNRAECTRTARASRRAHGNFHRLLPYKTTTIHPMWNNVCSY